MVWPWLGQAALLLTGAWLVYGVIPTCYYKYGRKLLSKVLSFPGQDRDSGEGQLILTFDDGPDPCYTPRLLELLAAEEVPAVFFVLANKAKASPELICRMREAGHLVGFHGLEHKNLWFEGPFATFRKFRTGLRCLKASGAPPLCYYRPPHGNLNLPALKVIRQEKLKLFLWDIMVQDWRGDSTVEGLLAKLCRQSQQGGVICLHDSGEGLAAKGAPERMLAALSRFLPEMKAQGYRFVLPKEEGGKNKE